MAKGKKKKRLTASQLAKRIEKFLVEKEVNEDNEVRFNKAMKKAVKPDSK